MKTAVIYFSRTHHTEQVAQIVGRHLQADLLQIKSELYPLGFRGYFRAIKHALKGRAQKIETSNWDLTQYDLVILGTPVWGSNISAPMNSFLLEKAAGIRRVAFFATCGGSGATQVFNRMSQLCKLEPVAKLVVTAKDFSQNSIEQKVKKFVEDIRLPQQVMHSEPVLQI